MTRADVASLLTQVVADELEIDVGKVTEASTLSGLGADDLSLTTIFAAVEEQFNLKPSDTRFDGVKTVGQAIDVIAKEM